MQRQESEETKRPCLGQRHVLVCLMSLGFLIGYCMRINMSIAIVAMVNSSALAADNKNTSMECKELIQPFQNMSKHEVIPNGEFRWSKQIQGIVLSSFFWGYGIFQIPAGTYAQKYGGKWIIGLGIVFTGVLSLLTPVVAKMNVYLLIVVRILEGIGESVTYPALQAMLGRWVPMSEAATLNTLCFLGSSLGSVIGVISSGAICFDENLGWPAVFYIDGALAILWFIPWCLLVFDAPIEHPRISDAERCYLRETTSKNQARINKLGVPWKNILCDRGTWAYIIGWVSYCWAFNNIMTTLPEFLSEILHFNIRSNGFISSLPFLSLCVFQVLFAFLSDELIRRTSLSRTLVRKLFTCLGLSGIVACFVAVMFTECDVWKTVSMLVLSLTTASLLYGGLYANPVEYCPEFSGTLFGISNSFGAITGIVAPIITDQMTVNGTRDEWNDVFLLTAAIAFTGAVVYFIFGSGKRRQWMELPNETKELMSSTALQYSGMSINA